MTDPVIYSSVIEVDGIRTSVDHPWEPDEYVSTMVVLELQVSFRDELDKQIVDAMCFGTGIVMVSGKGVRHIPVSEWHV